MGTVGSYVAIIGGALVIGASLWRLGTTILRGIRRFDRIMNEHETILRTIDIHGKAIKTLQQVEERRVSRRG